MLWRMFSAHVPTAGPARPRPQRRVAGLLAGLVLVSGSVGLIAAGAFAVFASAGTTYVGLGAHGTYESDRYALATDGTDWRTQVLGWAESVRLEIASQDHEPIFLGVAPPREIPVGCPAPATPRSPSTPAAASPASTMRAPRPRLRR